MYGQGCTYCGRERTIKARTKEIDINECVSLCNKHGFIFVSAEKGNGKTFINFVCKKHQELGMQKMSKSNMNRDIKGCKYCKGDLPEWYVREKIKNEHPNIEIIGDYKNLSTPVKCKCLAHGVEWNIKPNEILKGIGCYQCGLEKLSAYHLHTHAEYIEMIHDSNPDVEVISQYKGFKEDITVKCKKCGYIWTLNAYSLKNNGTRCRKCSYTYKGEDKIISILNSIGCDYVHQHKFEDCRDKRSLPFDFYIPKYNLCIEFDGQQHFEPRFGKENLKILKYHDEIKNAYCEKNGISLLRIPYWKSDEIEKIIKDKIHSIETN